MSPRPLRDDEAGVFAVVEAILVAILILTAILFFTSVQRPTTGSEARGIDLGQVSTDTLGILQRRHFTATVPCPATAPATDLDLEAWLTCVVDGRDPSLAATVDSFLTDILPTGSQHTLLLSNGVGSETSTATPGWPNRLVLLPLTSPGAPHGARAAQLPVLMHWQSFASQTMTDTALTDKGYAAPGQIITTALQPTLYLYATSASILCLKAPDGSKTGPAGASWVSLWQTQPDGPGTIRVPPSMLYGTWAGYTDGACSTGATYARVTLPGRASGGPVSDYPMYGLQLVVWFGA